MTSHIRLIHYPEHKSYALEAGINNEHCALSILVTDAEFVKCILDAVLSSEFTSVNISNKIYFRDEYDVHFSKMTVLISDATHQIENFLNTYFNMKLSYALDNSGIWYYFDGRVWGKVEDILSHVAKRVETFAPYTDVEKIIHTTLKTPTILIKTISNMIKLIKPEDIKSKLDMSHLLAFNNGVYDLQTKRFRDIRKNDYVTKTVGYSYHSNADENPELEEFLSTTFTDVETREMLYDNVSDIVNMKNARLHVWVGSGANGKTVMLTLIKLLLGDYVEIIPTTYITRGYITRDYIAHNHIEYPGVKLIIVREIKQDVLSKHNIDYFTDSNQHLVTTCNVLPEIDGTLHNPMNVLSFTSTFVENPSDAHEFSRKYINNDKQKEWRAVLINKILTR